MVAVVVQVSVLAGLARLLLPKEFGVLAIVMTITTVGALLADFGFANYIIHCKHLSRQLLRKIFAISIFGCVLLSIVAWVFAEDIARFCSAPAVTLAVRISTVPVVLSGMTAIVSSLLQKNFCFIQISKSEIVATLLNGGMSIGLAISGFGFYSILGGQILGGLVKLVLLYPEFLNRYRLLEDSCSKDADRAIVFTMYQFTDKLLSIVTSNGDKIIVGKMLGPEALGVYTIAWQILSRPISLINPIVNRVMLPVLCQNELGDRQLQSVYIKMLKMLAALLFPIYIFVAFSPHLVMRLFAGDNWAHGAPILTILSARAMLQTLGNPIGTLIVAKGVPQLGLILNCICVLIGTGALIIGCKINIVSACFALLIVDFFGFCITEPIFRYKIAKMSIVNYAASMRFVVVGLLLSASGSIVYNTWLVRIPNAFIQLAVGLIGSTFFVFLVVKFDTDVRLKYCELKMLLVYVWNNWLYNKFVSPK